MTDVQVFTPFGRRISSEIISSDKTQSSSSSDSFINAFNKPSDEFASCVSNSNPSTADFPKGPDRFGSSPPLSEIQPLSTSHKHEETHHHDSSTTTCGKSRYGLEPMSLVFGMETQESIRKTTGRNKVMSAVEPHRPPISIKQIGDYDLIKTIGAGSTGKVKLAIHRKTKEKAAVKIVPRKQLDLSQTSQRPNRETSESRERRILREAGLLNIIDHPHIVKLKDFLITPDYFCLFFEFVEGLQLLDYIIMHGRMNEKEARTIFRQLLSAVHYCHHYSIVHRDLKIENILLDEKSGVTKLLDFGLSNFYQQDELLNTFCGSLYFAAPELLCGTVYTGPEVDVWSLGVILFVMVTGKVPFDDKNLSMLHAKIKACQLQIPDRLSANCRDLLGRMICRDPERRATMEQVLKHPWVVHTLGPPCYEPPSRHPLNPLDEAVITLLVRDFNVQYDEQEIRKVLMEAAHQEISSMSLPLSYHPIISLYLLARDKIYDSSGQIRLATVKISTSERSKSLPFIYDASDSSQELGAATLCGLETIPEVNRPRSKSLSVAGTSVPPPSHDQDDQLLDIRTIYLKGFFATQTRTTQGPRAIRNEIFQYLIQHGIRYEDNRSYFICDYRPSIKGQYGRLVFEIHIVKLAFLGMHGLQFKRIYGDVSQYKRLQSEMITSLNLA